MADITWTHVTDHAPGLTGVSGAAQIDILDLVNNLLEVDLFGGEDATKLKLARVYLAAHMGQLWKDSQTGGGSAGPALLKELGDMKTQYASGFGTFSAETYGTTRYGQQFVALRRTTLAVIGFVP